MFKYTNPSDPENVFLKAKLKEWLKLKLKTDAEVEAEFNELSCGIDHCPCITTEIKVTSPVTETFRIGKPLVYIRKWDLENVTGITKSFST